MNLDQHQLKGSTDYQHIVNEIKVEQKVQAHCMYVNVGTVLPLLCTEVSMNN